MDRKNRFTALRELTGFFLLTALLLAGLLSAWYMHRQNAPIAAAVQDSAWLALSGQWENARHQADDARNRWSGHRTACAVLGDHRPMEEIDALFAELRIHAAAENRPEFARVCSVLAEKLKTLAGNHQLTWQNIL